ncbi:MAG: DUF3861 domain-containing protein [Candidatus Acinetobacter avistercoris]|uniref:DUF3861 domain-containing protein n=1 Tax=Acinetobacter sp. KS-LM10 TaxID=3120518 RepID=UPI001F9A51D7|nr:DUF3861 domain-containing protein [Candidatus Acinetobacter avistercoris]
MKQHEYKISVEHIADAKGNPSTYTEALEFTAYNHDDLFKVLAHLQKTELVDEESTKALAIGLKLFGEVLLLNKDVTIFKEFLPQFIQFIQTLKKSAPSQI